MKTRTRSRTPARTDFAIVATLCLINEGIDPSVTMGLRCRCFNLAEHWVEFVPWRAVNVVRRSLSLETAAFLSDRIKYSSLDTDAPLCVYQPKKIGTRKRSRTVGIHAARWVREELELVDSDWQVLNAKALKWIWTDEHPDLREQEIRAQLLALFVLKWPKDFQKEALLQRIYEGTPVLRPSWAYPQWHKDVVARSFGSATNGEGSGSCGTTPEESVSDKKQQLRQASNCISTPGRLDAGPKAHVA